MPAAWFGVGGSGVAIGWAGWAPECRGPEFQANKIIFPLQWGKLLADLQILGCQLHKNASGLRLGAIALPRFPSRYKGRKGKEGE